MTATGYRTPAALTALITAEYIGCRHSRGAHICSRLSSHIALITDRSLCAGLQLTARLTCCYALLFQGENMCLFECTAADRIGACHCT